MNRVLIIRGGAIGDFILTLPSLHVLRDHHPQTRIEILGYSHIVTLAHQRFYANGVRSIDDRAVAGFFAARGTLDSTLSSYLASFDLVVSYLYDPDSIFHDNLKRAGVRRVIVADGRPAQKQHASEHLAAWLQTVGLPLRIEAPRLYPLEQDHEDAGRNFPGLPAHTIALHPGSGSEAKNWPITRFIELARWLMERGFHILLVSGPADRQVETEFCGDAVAGGCTRCRGVALPTLAAALQKCTAFIGHDSGISHLCAGVGTPTVAIFGGTDPRIWGPRGRSVTIVQTGPGVSSVTVEDVKNALEPQLAKAEK